MRYKVLGGQWGEGHQPGDVIDLDCNAARKRVEIGDLELIDEKPKKKRAPRKKKAEK